MKKHTTATQHFVVCLSNDGYPASLQVGKLYRTIPDQQAAQHGYLRVVDESGEDYAYSAERFFPVELPLAVSRVLLSATQKVAA